MEIIDSFSGNIYYVGGHGNYKKIQDAINDAQDGDTVFVFAGMYYENVVVDKSINLIGEDRNTTVIDGGKKGDVVKVDADCVTICGFTVRNSKDHYSNYGIKMNSNSLFHLFSSKFL